MTAQLTPSVLAEPATPARPSNERRSAAESFTRTSRWYETASDEDLLAAAADEDDTSAFAGLVDRYQDKLYTFVLRFSGDRSDAFEAAQDVFLSAWKSRATFRGDSSVSTWLYTIARNTMTDRGRRRKARPETLIAEMPDHASVPDHADELLQRLDLQAALHAALSGLPEAFRTAVILFDVLDLAQEQIAEITGAPVKTVRSRIFRGRAQLAAKLSGGGGV